MGYRLGAYALGYVDDLRDPIEIVRPDLKRAGFASLPAAVERPRTDVGLTSSRAERKRSA